MSRHQHIIRWVLVVTGFLLFSWAWVHFGWSEEVRSRYEGETPFESL